MLKLIWISLACLFVCSPQSSAENCDTQAEPGTVLGYFNRKVAKNDIVVPESVGVNALEEKPGLGPQKYKGLKIDINGDGVDDYIIMPEPMSCGNGGCEYTLIDGASGKLLGGTFGEPIYVMKRKINGQPVIIETKSMGADKVMVSTEVFDGKCYVTISSVYLQGDEAIKHMYDENAALKNAPLLK